MRGTLHGAFQGLATFGIGKYIPLADNAFGNIAAHMMLGGMLEEMNGGDFGHGMLSAGLSKIVGLGIDGLDVSDPLKIVLQGIAGGALAEADGGDFANGAASFALQFAFNQALSRTAIFGDPTSEGYGVDVNLMRKSDPTYLYGNEIKQESNTVTALAHGKTYPNGESAGELSDGKQDYDGFGVGAKLRQAPRFLDMIKRGEREINVKIYACSTGAIATHRGQAIRSVGDEVLLDLQKAYPQVTFNVFAAAKPMAPYGAGYARAGIWYSVKKDVNGKSQWDLPVVWLRQDGRK